MFWGGSSKDKKEEPPKTLGELALSGNKPQKPEAGGSAAQSIHGFDPSALERAAKAARELDRSSNAPKALQTIMAAESTKQKEAEAERAKFQAYQQELAIKRIQEEEQSAARTLEKQSQHERQRSEYKDQLERKRMIDQINAQRHLNEEERKKQEESVLRQEEMRRKTLEHEASLRQQTEMARIKAETEGKIKQERDNHDLIIEKKRVEAKEFRETVLEAIKLAGTNIGAGVKDFITDKTKLTNTAAVVTAIALGVYSARAGTSITGKYIESRLGKPSLIRDTTRTNVLGMVRHPFSTLKNYLKKGDTSSVFKDIVLEDNLDRRLRRIAGSTINTTKNRAPYRHMLLHGPPGTGKTMFAKSLARASGMHYAIMTGGDVAPLGKEAVTEIHKLFDWANTSSKGVLIFVDEADAFLRKRSTERISEDMRNALNAFLYRTGEASQKFMIIFASNQPEQLDWAINDRIDELVEFGLPSLEERVRMIAQYIESYLVNPPAGSKQIIVQGVDDTLIRSFAAATEGYSGREISKLAIAWQAAAYGTENAVIDAELLTQVLMESKSNKTQKIVWNRHGDNDRVAEVINSSK